MAAKNDVTGDSLISRSPSKAYRDNYDLVFPKEKPQNEEANGSKDEQTESRRKDEEANPS